MQVHATIAGVRIGYYSRRQQQSTSRSETSGVRSGRRMAGMAAAGVIAAIDDGDQARLITRHHTEST